MNFNPKQLEVINFTDGNCRVVASAGSGKSTTVVHRVKNLIESHNVAANKILCISFTKKSKEELIDRFSELMPNESVNVETFHSLGLKIINHVYKFKHTMIDAEWKKDKIIIDIIKNKLELERSENDILVPNIKLFLSMQKSYSVSPKDKLINIDNLDLKYNEKQLQKIYSLYEQAKKKDNLLDFDDLLFMSKQILSSPLDWESYCLGDFREKFEYFLIDEFQDTSKIQIELVQLLSDKKNVMVVGDYKQNIYKFRASDNEFMLNFKNYFPNPTTIFLNTNYRSSDEIIDYSNKFSKCLDESTEDKIDTVGVKGSKGEIKFNHFKDEYKESEFVAESIQKLMLEKGYDYSDFMVVSRSNGQLASMCSTLKSKNVPTKGFSLNNIFEIKLVLSYLKLANDVKDDMSFEYIYNKPNRWLSKKFLEEVKDYTDVSFGETNSLYENIRDYRTRNKIHWTGVKEIVKIIETLRNEDFSNVGEMIEYLRKELEIDKYLRKTKKIEDENIHAAEENLNALVSLASKFDSLSEFIDNMKDLPMEGDEDGVLLTTIHGSKGLESKVVFVIGVSESLLPHRKCADVAEEKRLYYVAITRAIEKLFVSSIQYYNNKKIGKSSFLKGA